MRNQQYILFAVALCTITSCKKLIEIDPPRSTITTEQLFSDNAQAEWAVSGIYSKLIHGTAYEFMSTAAEKNFGAGLSTILGSFSSDEMYNAAGAGRADLGNHQDDRHRAPIDARQHRAFVGGAGAGGRQNTPSTPDRYR